MHKFGINLYGVFVGKSKTAYFWSLILFRACLVAVFNKNSVFNLRREKLPCISVSHNHYLSLSLSLLPPLSLSALQDPKIFAKKKNSKKSTKFQFAKPIKQPNTPNLKTEEEDSVQERKRPKKKNQGRRKKKTAAREREREREREGERERDDDFKNWT